MMQQCRLSNVYDVYYLIKNNEEYIERISFYNCTHKYVMLSHQDK